MSSEKIIQIQIDQSDEGYFWGLSNSGALYRLILKPRGKSYWELVVDNNAFSEDMQYNVIRPDLAIQNV